MPKSDFKLCSHSTDTLDNSGTKTFDKNKILFKKFIFLPFSRNFKYKFSWTYCHLSELYKRQKKRMVCIIWGGVNRKKDEFTQMLPA